MEAGPGPWSQWTRLRPRTRPSRRRVRSASRALHRLPPKGPVGSPRTPLPPLTVRRPSRTSAEPGAGSGSNCTAPLLADPAPRRPSGPGDPCAPGGTGASGVPKPLRGHLPPPAASACSPRPARAPPSRVTYLVAFSRGTPDAVGDSRGLIHVRRSWGPRRCLPNFWARLRRRAGRPLSTAALAPRAPGSPQPRRGGAAAQPRREPEGARPGAAFSGSSPGLGTGAPANPGAARSGARRYVRGGEGSEPGSSRSEGWGRRRELGDQAP